MEINLFFKSVFEQDPAPVVLCDLEHTVVYVNPAAASRYEKAGGADLVGKSLMRCHNAASARIIDRVLRWFSQSKTHNRVFESRNEKENKDVYIVALRDDRGNLIGYYEKHEYRTHETAPFYDLTDA